LSLSAALESATSPAADQWGLALGATPAHVIADSMGVALYGSLRDRPITGRIEGPEELAWMLGAPLVRPESGRARIGGPDRAYFALPAGDLLPGEMGARIGDQLAVRADTSEEGQFRRELLSRAALPASVRVEVLAVWASRALARDWGAAVERLSIRADVDGLQASGGIAAGVSLLAERRADWGRGSRRFVGSVLSGRQLVIDDGTTRYLDDAIALPGDGGTGRVSRGARARRVGQRLQLELSAVGSDWVGSLVYSDGRETGADSSSSTDWQLPLRFASGNGAWQWAQYSTGAEGGSRASSWFLPRTGASSGDADLILAVRLVLDPGAVPAAVGSDGGR